MSEKTLLVSEKFDPKKKYNVHIRKQVSQVLKDLEKGKQYQLSELIAKYDDVVIKSKNIENTRNVLKHVVKAGKY